MSTGTMAKKRQSTRLKMSDKEIALIESVDMKPKPRTTSYVPPPHSACAAERPKGENYTRVETTRGRIRYCRCMFCGVLFKDVDTTS